MNGKCSVCTHKIVHVVDVVATEGKMKWCGKNGCNVWHKVWWSAMELYLSEGVGYRWWQNRGITNMCNVV